MNRLMLQRVVQISLLDQNIKFENLWIKSIRFISNQENHQSVLGIKNIQPLSTPKSISLRHCSPYSVVTSNGEPWSITTVRRPLVIIMSWLFSKDHQIEKYRQLWFRRGFDVLTVKTSLIDLLVPPIGGEVVAKNLVEYLLEISPQFYKEIVIHAFSVGGYQFGKFLQRLTSSEEYQELCQSIKGTIFDSPAHVESFAPGLSKMITENPNIQPLLEQTINGFLKITKRISLDNYKMTSQHIFANPLRLPALILYSSDDKLSDYKLNEKFVKRLLQSGADTQYKCWSKSAHVLLYRDHQLEYEQQLDHFLKNLKLESGYV